VTTTLNGADVTIAQPWLVYTLFALVLGVALILLTIRNLPPVHGRRMLCRRRHDPAYHRQPLPPPRYPPAAASAKA